MQKSRADRERALYIHKLTLIKENMLHSQGTHKQEVLLMIQQNIQDELEKVKEGNEDSEDS